MSIIIPCKNVEEYLANTLDSALSQSYAQIEVILVDNNSSDNTWSIMLSYQELNPSLVSCYREYRSGATAARNKGLAVAKGDWIQFLDADDLLLPSKIERQLKLITYSQERISLVVGSSIYRGFAMHNQIQVSQKIDPWLGLVKGELGNTCSNLWLRKALEMVGGWNEKQESSQEYELMFRMLKQSTALLFDETPQTIIQRRANSISTTDLSGNRFRAADLHLSMFEYVLENQPDSIEKYQYGFYHSVLKHVSVLGLFESARAKRYYQDWIPADFFIQDPTFGRFYQVIYNTFGFTIAQFLYRPYIFLRRLATPDV